MSKVLSGMLAETVTPPATSSSGSFWPGLFLGLSAGAVAGWFLRPEPGGVAVAPYGTVPERERRARVRRETDRRKREERSEGYRR